MFTFSVFDQKYPFWANLVQKNQNCHLELKFATYANLNMQKSIVVFAFSIFDRKNLFWSKFSPKNQNYQFELKFGT